MYLLGKLENGYLQLVRIIFLVLATLALIVAIVEGVPAVMDYNAKAAAVPSDITVKASAFRLETDQASPDEQNADAAPTDPAEKEKASLVDGLHTVLLKHGKSLVGTGFALQKDDLQGLVGSWVHNSDRGADYAKAQTKYLDDVLSRADVGKKVNGSQDQFFAVVNSAITQFAADWTKQHAAIATKKVAAEEQASAKRIGALQSVSVVAGATGLFITLVLSLIMFRVDRSIRQMANAGSAG
ncbi:hypothetical protein NOV72_00664 [Caballeronia novacaledonica]|uniref:Methyl-accepting chemotaxis protein n=1 Tax=Caballeronia novacaledonica TaxID=1544861 RepID=A0A2U3HZX8_9BURK|nr:hypothetical protein [Caballeronia novacaledonica]SPB13366.1 hypothetical protein NOV72_00664 [Caballeronia novacaledonica]